MASCVSTAPPTPKTTFDASNPFFAASTLPFHAAAFDKIRDADFKPAIEEGIRQKETEIQQIADDTAAPTVANTVVALEKSGQLLTRTYLVFGLLTGANTDDTLKKVEADEAEGLAKVDDTLYLNSKLYARVKAVYDQREQLHPDPETKRLVEYYKQKFDLAGAGLPDAQKDQLKELNKEEATLMVQFNHQLLAANEAGALVVNDTAALAGLSSSDIQAAAEAARAKKIDGKWLLPLQNTTQQPDLQSLKDRKTRQQLFEASWTRTEKGDSNDTRKVIARIAQIRVRKAKLLGYANYAQWVLKDQMAHDPETVGHFLDKLVPAVTKKAAGEAADIQALIDKQHGGFQLQPYDWNFYSEQVRKAKYDLNDEEIKPYFVLDSVLKNGVFYAANLLYGLTFSERTDLPVYNKDVHVFNVFDADGKPLALFYCDYFRRDNKNGGAWMSNMVQQSKLLNTQPVIYNVANFAKPVAGQPALVSFSDVTTMFHEFGHGLHGMFADQQYPSLSGANTARDFVEFPSQFNERWALDPKVFAHYAHHYKTGAPMPQALVDKIKKAGTFNKGYDYTELLAAAALDLQWHELTNDSLVTDVDAFETGALHRTHLDLPQVPSRYRSSYFLHIWSNGYAAGYYAYSWTKMLADDAYSWFEEHGGLTRENGQHFREMILSRGNTIEYGKMFRDFRGHDPDIKPLLTDLGIQ
jgi:peptidyl-dipeptidase Dcp